jgi:hypothetical protein
MDRHLVAVEVGVEGPADQRVDLDRLALDHRLESLMPRRWSVGARLRSTGWFSMISPRMSHTSGFSRSTRRFAL